ncbi:MAG: hypothetical protein RJQ08_08365 [Salinisphaeraceae bacterium]
MSKLEIADLAGGRVDSFKMELSDDGSIVLPPAGTELNIYLGYREVRPVHRGLFAVDQVAHSGPPSTLTYSATGVDFIASARAPKERTHEPQTLATLLDKLASPHGYTPVVRPSSLGRLELPLIDQAGQSDLALADELARTYGGIFKPVDGVWAILGYGVLGEPALTLRPQDVSTWRAHFMPRREFQAVTAHYHDYGAAERTPVTAGEGEPVKVLNRTYETADVALAHAKSTLARGRRKARSLTLTLPGRPDLATHTVLGLDGFRERVDNRWLITQVTHTLDKRGYRCRVEAEGL